LLIFDCRNSGLWKIEAEVGTPCFISGRTQKKVFIFA